MIYEGGKRIMDIAIAGFLLLMLSIPGVLIAMAVWVSMGRPVLFRQTRVGRGGQQFDMIKFRTMTDSVDYEGGSRPDVDRITGLGRFLRRTSLDELPELWNVMRGEMSLVGPRPLLVDYLPYYTANQARRHTILPGITGWAQVSGRNSLSWEEKFEYDLYYVDHRSLFFDIKILMMTVVKVMLREGIDSAPDLPMPRFDDHIKASWSNRRDADRHV